MASPPAVQPASSSSASNAALLQEANAQSAEDQIAYFRAIPWCAALLSQPGLFIDQAVCRRLNPTDGLYRNSLFSRALNTPDAIPAYIVFYSPPPVATDATTVPMMTELDSLVALGPMINGHDGVCHGGLVVALLDEVMGQLVDANRTRGAVSSLPAMTGYLNSRFERPVLTGTAERARAVRLTARITRSEGRKLWLEGEVMDDGGVVLARADAMFIVLKEKL